MSLNPTGQVWNQQDKSETNISLKPTGLSELNKTLQNQHGRLKPRCYWLTLHYCIGVILLADMTQVTVDCCNTIDWRDAIDSHNPTDWHYTIRWHEPTGWHSASDCCDSNTADWHDSIVTLSTRVTPLTGVTYMTPPTGMTVFTGVTPPKTRAHSLNKPIFKRVNGIAIFKWC